MMFSGFKLSEALDDKQKCFRLFEFVEGEYIERFYEYIPSHRISSDAAIALLKSLIIKRLPNDDHSLMRAHLNNRAGAPQQIQLFNVKTEYPEPGVIRKYVCSSPYLAWVDEVIRKDVFRNEGRS